MLWRSKFFHKTFFLSLFSYPSFDFFFTGHIIAKKENLKVTEAILHGLFDRILLRIAMTEKKMISAVQKNRMSILFSTTSSLYLEGN